MKKWFFRKETYHALVDLDSGSILVLSRNFHILNYMRDFYPDTQIIFFDAKNFFERSAARNLATSDEKYKYTIKKHWGFPTLIKNQNIVAKELSEIATCKYIALHHFYNIIETRRLIRSQKRTLAFQEMIYIAKKYEAKEFLEKGCPEDNMLDFIYIKQYAELKNISYKQSAEEILFKSKLSDAFLARSEQMRLKYFNLLKKSKTKEEVEKLIKDFNYDLEFI